ncbi:response regulator transcription factor [Gordonia sp. DT30]|uniref:response regulator transcription factor n=1 Tax=Gordonia sp. DT30 TaxID=3416546 RepID=UPI003CF14C54
MAGPRLARASISRIDDYRQALPRNGFHPIAPIAPVRPAIGPAGPSAAALAEPVRRPVLSPRETEVLLAWLAADSKEEAAEHLFIAASTVSTHLARIRAKYAAIGRSAPTKTHLLARALQDGITRLEDW